MLGVTSSEMPEKKGCTPMFGVVAVLLPTAVVVLEMLVTKKSSVPTLSTAFWLFMVAMRGLESTCVLPWLPRKSSTAAKLGVWKARPSRLPAVVAADSSAAPGVTEMRPSPMLAPTPLGESEPPGETTPKLARVFSPNLKADQLMPVRSLSRNCTSTTLASSITWRCTETRVASR